MKHAFEQAKVIPILIFEDAAAAVPTADALIEGGLSVLEVTLRTDAAWDALAAIMDRHPQATIGVGTVLDEDQMARAKEVGAAFAVSPGFDPSLATRAKASDLFYLPGVATATEVMRARREGFRFMKFFPAEAAGGIALLKSFVSPFRDIAFCPTGGIGPANVADYLALPNVVCVGGSWVATANDIARNDWKSITGKAKAAAQMTLF